MNAEGTNRTNEYRLVITEPECDGILIDFGRHFSVEGIVETADGRPPEQVPECLGFQMELLDASGETVRSVSADRCCLPKLYTEHPGFTRYPDDMDPDLSELQRYGFVPLIVEDENDPHASLKNAQIKCFCDGTRFKGMFVTATDTGHGLVLPDGMAYTDSQGNPYTALAEGEYTIRVRLMEAGVCKAEALRVIRIASPSDRAICRFNPAAHKENMEKWCRSIGVEIGSELIPGYLNPYLGVWLYHMGLLKMYRAGDAAMYLAPKVHMFLYNITPDSTSYETELSFLQVRQSVGKRERFTAYAYDIGEARLGKCTDGLHTCIRQGQVIEFPPDRFMRICRVDVVNEKARENEFLLDESAVIYSIPADDEEEPCFAVPSGARIAVMGVVRPWQMEPDDFMLRGDNTYEVRNKIETLKYVFLREYGYEIPEDVQGAHEFRCGVPERRLMMERFETDTERTQSSIGRSVFEFYNIFKLPNLPEGYRIEVKICGYDSREEETPASALMILEITGGSDV